MKSSNLAEFSKQVVDVMPLLVREFAKREDNELTRGKISCPQLVALEHVSRQGKATVGEIANILSVKPSSASVLLDRLFREKMLVRASDRNDRRLVWLKPTARGRKVVSQIMAQKRRSIAEVFSTLSSDERGQYLKVLLKLKAEILRSAIPVRGRRTVKALALAAALVFTVVSGVFAAETPKAPTGGKLDVLEAYRLAFKQSESVAVTEKEIDLARSRFYRSFNYFLPKVHFQMSHFQQDVDDATSGGGFNFGRRTVPENRFTFSQPIFSGFKEIAALRGSGADRKAQQARWRRAQELLFIDVMESFYNVLSARLDEQTLEEQKKLLEDRLSELGDRVKLGRSREGESKTAIADAKIVEADLVTARSALARAENLLSFYLGQPVSAYALDDSAAPAGETNLESALVKAATRSDVTAAKELHHVATQRIIAAQADLFPTASLDGNYYTRRPGFQDGNDWDVTVTFDVPVFEVGTTLGDIKEAHALREQARLTEQETLRMAELDIRDSFEDFRAAREADTALAAAAAASKENSELETADYRLNLVNNLDVLDSLRRSLDVRRRANDAKYEAKKSGWRFQIALGELPA